LWDEITEIERDPVGRGNLFEDEFDPEFAGMRYALGVTGYAIFYVPYPRVDELYVTSIRPWDFPDLPAER